MAIFRCFCTENGLITLGLLTFIIGWALGIWAIATKTPLAYGLRVAIGVGFAIGLPAMILMWAKIWEDSRFGWPEVRKPALIFLGILFVCIGVGIWAVFSYADLPQGEKINMAVGIGVGAPCLYTLWVMLVQEGILLEPIIITATLIGVLAPSLWAILTKSSLSQDVRVSLSIGLGIGFPCLVPIGFLLWET